MIYENIDQLKKGIEGALKVVGDDVKVLNEEILRSRLIDDLIYSAVFSPDKEIKNAATWLIRRAGVALGIVSASIQSLYEAMGRGGGRFHGSGHQSAGDNL